MCKDVTYSIEYIEQLFPTTDICRRIKFPNKITCYTKRSYDHKNTGRLVYPIKESSTTNENTYFTNNKTIIIYE